MEPKVSSENHNPFSFANYMHQRESSSQNGQSQKGKTCGSYGKEYCQEIEQGCRFSPEDNHRKKYPDDSFDIFTYNADTSFNDFGEGESTILESSDTSIFYACNENTKGKSSRILKIVNDEVHEIKGNYADSHSKDDHAELSSDSDNGNRSGSDDSSCVSPLSASYILPSATSLTGSEASLLQSDLYQLEQENLRLKQELEQLKEDIRNERLEAKQRIEGLVREVRFAKRKEAEETAALERVVQMVEENLENTTRRAVKAETNVTRLKEELKALKEDSVPRSLYDTVLEEYESTLASVREKSQSAANSMRQAAVEAEPAIRDIAKGLKSLRYIAEQFDDIDKITEITQMKSNST